MRYGVDVDASHAPPGGAAHRRLLPDQGLLRRPGGGRPDHLPRPREPEDRGLPLPRRAGPGRRGAGPGRGKRGRADHERGPLAGPRGGARPRVPAAGAPRARDAGRGAGTEGSRSRPRSRRCRSTGGRRRREPHDASRPGRRPARPIAWPARRARTSSSTSTTRSTGTPGVTRRSSGRVARTGRSSCPSATRPVTGATSWSASRSRIPAIAGLMNERFVNIKVDREERPDVDSIYMQAVQSMTGHGGWPMTVFLTPDGVPFYGGTYFPPGDRHGMPGFPRVLEAVAEYYRDRRGDATQVGPGVARSAPPGGARPRRAGDLLDALDARRRLPGAPGRVRRPVRRARPRRPSSRSRWPSTSFSATGAGAMRPTPSRWSGRP